MLEMLMVNREDRCSCLIEAIRREYELNVEFGADKNACMPTGAMRVLLKQFRHLSCIDSLKTSKNFY